MTMYEELRSEIKHIFTKEDIYYDLYKSLNDLYYQAQREKNQTQLASIEVTLEKVIDAIIKKHKFDTKYPCMHQMAQVLLRAYIFEHVSEIIDMREDLNFESIHNVACIRYSPPTNKKYNAKTPI